jgi:hypothetical protein
MIFIYLIILFFIGLLIYQFLLEEEGFTDNDIKGINDKLAKLTSTVNANNTVLTTLNTYVNNTLKPNMDIFIEKLPQINAIIENSAEMDAAIERGEAVVDSEEY